MRQEEKQAGSSRGREGTWTLPTEEEGTTDTTNVGRNDTRHQVVDEKQADAHLLKEKKSKDAQLVQFFGSNDLYVRGNDEEPIHNHPRPTNPAERNEG